MITTDAPSLWGKIRHRFGVRTGTGRSGDLKMSIQPVTQMDGLALLSRMHYDSQTISGDVTITLATCPPGEFWHLKSGSLNPAAAGTYNTRMVVLVEDYATPGTIRHVPVQGDVPADGAYTVFGLHGIIMRPGDRIDILTSGHSINSTLVTTVEFDLEDCLS